MSDKPLFPAGIVSCTGEPESARAGIKHGRFDDDVQQQLSAPYTYGSFTRLHALVDAVISNTTPSQTFSSFPIPQSRELPEPLPLVLPSLQPQQMMLPPSMYQNMSMMYPPAPIQYPSPFMTPTMPMGWSPYYSSPPSASFPYPTNPVPFVPQLQPPSWFPDPFAQPPSMEYLLPPPAPFALPPPIKNLEPSDLSDTTDEAIDEPASHRGSMEPIGPTNEQTATLLLSANNQATSHGLGGRAPHKAVTYAALIAMAIYSMPNHKAKIHDIYRFIEDHSRFVQDGLPPNYKFSVRHNLSTRPGFIRIDDDSSKRNSWWSLDESKLPEAARNAITSMLEKPSAAEQ